MPTPMILGCGLIDDIRKAVTADMKSEGDRLYLVGRTKDEMGASLFFRKFGGKGGDVPDVDADHLKLMMDKMLDSMDKELVKACHDCSDGGLAVAAAEMCISGGIGLRLDLTAMGDMFMGPDAVCIGITGGDRFIVNDSKIDLSLDEISRAWNEPMWNLMGGGYQ